MVFAIFCYISGLAYFCYETKFVFLCMICTQAANQTVASHAGVFRGARISSLPTNACSVMGSSLCFFLRFSFKIIFILLHYVATIAMKAFYIEALRIAFKHCYDFQLHEHCSSID